MGTVEDHGRKENEMQILQDEAPTVLAEPRAWQALAVDECARSLPGRRGALRADLGYALSAWQPRHENCEDFSSVDLAEW